MLRHPGAVGVIVSICFVGCGGDPIVGSWESEERTMGQADVFELEEDGDEIVGDGTFYSALPGQACPVSIRARPGFDELYEVIFVGILCLWVC
jgi:hypothetical protein